MVRRNAILMVFLSGAVVALTLCLASRFSPGPSRKREEVRQLLRKLADSDPDVRREGERELRSLGPRAVEVLQEAARSSDRVLAERAARILGGTRPPPAPRPLFPSPEPPEIFREPEETTWFVLEGGPPLLHPAEAAWFYVRLRNPGPHPVLLARDAVGRYSRFARFEVTDGMGRIYSVPPESFPSDPGPEPEVVRVGPGETFDLYAGQGDGRTLLAASFLPSGLVRVRFIYDAGGEAYREAVRGHPEGLSLPSQELPSNLVSLRVAN